MKRSNGVVAFAFGVPAGIRSNRQIAHMAITHSRILGKVPIFTQADVDLADAAKLHGIEVFRVTERPGQPPPSLRIAREAVRWARRWQIPHLWIACSLPHSRRCLRDLRQAVSESGYDIAVTLCDMSRFRYDSWFCTESTQPRTRTRQAWEKRELILLKLPFWIYKRLAA